MSHIRRALSLLALLYSASISVNAAPGDFDRQFGNQGKVVFSLNGYLLHSGMATLQADNKILFAGTGVSTNGAARSVVVRFLPNGELDSSFGTAGVALLKSVESPLFMRTDSISLLSDGGIRVGGQVCMPVSECLLIGDTRATVTVAALTSTGAIDNQFGLNGIYADSAYADRASGANGWAPTFTATLPAATDTPATPETTIVMYDFGGFSARVPARPVLARLSIGGIKDASFPPPSTLIPLGGMVPNSATNALLPVAGRKIIIGGAFLGGAYSTLVRLTANGELDVTFGHQGSVGISDTNERISSLVITPANKLLVLTRPLFGIGGVPLLAQLSEEGVLDTGFAPGGIARLDSLSSLGMDPISASVDESGRLAILATKSASDQALVVVRLNSQFGLDSSFGNGGMVPVGFGVDRIQAVSGATLYENGGLLKQADGKLVAFGGNGGSLVLVRLLTSSDPILPAGTSPSGGGCFGPTISSKVDPMLPLLALFGFLGITFAGRKRARH